MSGRDTLEQPVPRALLAIALPLLASQLLRLAFQWVDALWVRGLGVEATAAVTTSVFVTWSVLALGDVLGIGVTAFVSQSVGAGQVARAGVVVRKALVANAAIGVAVAALGLWYSEALFALIDPGAHVVASGAAYLRVLLLGTPFLLTATCAEAAMRACGDSRTPLRLDLLAIGLNIVLAPVFIYGAGPVPAMGVAGAALATVIAYAALSLMYLRLALRRHPALPVTRGEVGEPVRLRSLAAVGFPGALIGALFSVAYLSFTRAASADGAAALAVVGIANRAEALLFVLSVSTGLGGAALLGQALGAGRIDRAEAVLRTGQRWAIGFASVLTVVFLAAPQFALGLFSQDPEVIRLGVPYLRVLAIANLATAIEVVTAETLLGSGHTRVMSVLFTITSLVRIPLAFWAVQRFEPGVLGIAWVITVTCILRASAVLAWARRGTWKRGLARELGAPPAAPSA